jgi:hypothetical protein
MKMAMAGGDLSALLVDLSGLQFGNALLSALGFPKKTLMWTAPEVASPAHFAEAPHSVPTWATGQNEPSTACKPASRLRG